MIYKRKIFERRNKFIKCIREEEIQCLGDDTITLELLGKGIVDKLRKDYSFCHLGLITIAIKGLRRKGLGTKTLVHIYDESWTDMGNAMIASTEIDMNNNIGIVYCMPDFMMSLKDLQQDIKIGIKTKGYEQQIKGSNLVINIGFIGRCTNYADNKVKIKVEDVVNLLTTKGVGMVKPEALSTENLAELTKIKIDTVTLEGKDYPIKRILYKADGVIAGEEDLLKIETLALRKGEIEEEEERLIYDNLRNIVVI